MGKQFNLYGNLIISYNTYKSHSYITKFGFNREAIDIFWPARACRASAFAAAGRAAKRLVPALLNGFQPLRRRI
jgi:hypothetical protein